MQPIVFQREKNNTRIIVRLRSNRMTLIDTKTNKVMRTVDLANHEAALFFANKLTI